MLNRSNASVGIAAIMSKASATKRKITYVGRSPSALRRMATHLKGLLQWRRRRGGLIDADEERLKQSLMTRAAWLPASIQTPEYKRFFPSQADALVMAEELKRRGQPYALFEHSLSDEGVDIRLVEASGDWRPNSAAFSKKTFPS